jgi:hypothetical protein
MLSPWLIRAVFALGLPLLVITGGALIAEGIRTGSWHEVAGGVGFIVFGPILLRLVCEYSILFFRMNETLNDINTLVDPLARDGPSVVSDPLNPAS